MIDVGLNILVMIFNVLKIPLFVIICICVLFAILCLYHYVIERRKVGRPATPKTKGTNARVKDKGLLYQLLCYVPKQYVLDKLARADDYFVPRGLHLFTGEQGSGKTIAMVHSIIKLQKQYPNAKISTNFAYLGEHDALLDWRMLLTYVNGHKGVIIGIDELQNWFMSGNNQLPVEMLEIITQNRKNNRIVFGTSQVFIRIAKGLREQVTLCYEPHTFLGCFTVVFKYKHFLDSEGNVKKRKYMGMYSFTHTKELRDAYDTYKVIHALSKEGFKASVAPASVVVKVGK